MGLNAAVFADDENEIKIASVRIGNLDGVVRLRESIQRACPEAAVLLPRVLCSAFHCGDTLEQPDLLTAKAELERVSKCCPNDSSAEEFAMEFGRLIETALAHGRPVTFA